MIVDILKERWHTTISKKKLRATFLPQVRSFPVIFPIIEHVFPKFSSFSLDIICLHIYPKEFIISQWLADCHCDSKMKWIVWIESSCVSVSCFCGKAGAAHLVTAPFEPVTSDVQQKPNNTRNFCLKTQFRRTLATMKPSWKHENKQVFKSLICD